MKQYLLHRNPDGEEHLDVPLRGEELLHQPLFNKGSGFSIEERIAFGLEGVLPCEISTMDEQVSRVYANIKRTDDPLQHYIALSALQDRNEHLFYRVMADYLEEFLPVVYTPTVGLACQEYSHIFRRSRGLWITPNHRGRIKDVLSNAPFEDVRLIVVTDNERILGLGDQGAGGMGIPIGKLSLYTTAAGIHPSLTLPISLDVGTDNEDLLADPLYLGYRMPRLRGEEYLSLVDEMVEAVKTVFPKVCLQWEDFKKVNAFRLLDRHRHNILSFNDDIEGTAAVAVAGVMSASRISGIPLQEQRIVIAGAGAAGVGIARQLRSSMSQAGLEGGALKRAIAVFDSRGLLTESRNLSEQHKREFAWPDHLLAQVGIEPGASLDTVISHMKPTVMIGTTGQPNYFTKEMVREMALHVERPVILPFSNPTSKCEATPADLLAWTEGRALVATGSPFDPVTIDSKTFHTGQGNNAFIFPGVGLGLLVAEATRVTDGVFDVACRVLAEQVTPGDLERGSLYPPVAELREVAREIAIGVVSFCRDAGIGREIADAEVPAEVDKFMWAPRYPQFRPC